MGAHTIKRNPEGSKISEKLVQESTFKEGEVNRIFGGGGGGCWAKKGSHPPIKIVYCLILLVPPPHPLPPWRPKKNPHPEPLIGIGSIDIRGLLKEQVKKMGPRTGTKFQQTAPCNWKKYLKNLGLKNAITCRFCAKRIPNTHSYQLGSTIYKRRMCLQYYIPETYRFWTRSILYKSLRKRAWRTPITPGSASALYS